MHVGNDKVALINQSIGAYDGVGKTLPPFTANSGGSTDEVSSWSPLLLLGFENAPELNGKRDPIVVLLESIHD